MSTPRNWLNLRVNASGMVLWCSVWGGTANNFFFAPLKHGVAQHEPQMNTTAYQARYRL